MATQVASLFGLISLKDELTPALKKAKGSVKDFADETEKSGGALSKLGGVAATAGVAVAAAAAAATVAAVHMASQFDKSLTNISAVTGIAGDKLKALGADLLAIGAHSIAGPQAVADAYYDVASGVTNAAARMATLKAAVALSEAGNASLASSTSALIAVMNSYTFSAEQAGFASDVLTRTVGVGVGTMEQFASALGPISGIAAKVGVKFEELGSAAAFLTTKGASASQAATRLQAAMVSMLNPNTQMTAALRKAGFASGEAAIKQLGLAGAVNALMKASGGSTEQMAKMAGSVEALQAMAALAGPEFAEFSKQFQEGLDGATAAAQKVQLGSFDAQWKMFTNSLGAAATAVGMLVLPALNGLISFINSAMGTVGKFSPLITEGLSKIAGIFQPLLTEINKVSGPITTAIGSIKNAFDNFFNTLFADTSINEAGKRLSKKLGETITPDQTLQEKIGPAFAKLKDTIGAELGKIDFAGIATGLLNAAASFGQNLARNILMGLLDLGSRLIASIGAQLSGIDIGAKAGELMTNAGKFGGKLIDNLLSGLTDIVTKVGDAVGKIDTVDIGAKAGKFLADALAFGGKMIGKLVSGLLGLDTQVGTEVGAQLDRVDILTRAGNLLGKVLGVGGSLIAKFNEGIASLGASFGNEIKKNLESIDILAAIQKLLTDAATNAQSLVGQFISGIGALGHDFGFKIADNLKSIDVPAAAKSLLDGALNLGKTIIDNAVSGIKGLADGLIKAIGEELGKVLDSIKAKAKEIGDAIAGAITGTGAGAPIPRESGNQTANPNYDPSKPTLNADGTVAQPPKLPGAFAVPTGVHGGQMAGGGMNMIPALANALQDQAGGADMAAQMQAQLDGAVEKLQPPAGLAAKIASFFSGADVTAALANLGTVITASIATTFGPDGAVMTALQPFADAWNQMFGGGGTISAAAVAMQATIDGLVASIVTISANGTPAIMEFESVSTSAAPNIAGSWQPVVGVFRELLMVLEGIAGAAARATSAMGAVPGVGGMGGARAGGGPVAAGKTYLVGENGPELFTAKSNGQIIPNGGTASVGGGGNINIQTVIVQGVQNPAAMYDAIRKEAQRRND